MVISEEAENKNLPEGDATMDEITPICPESFSTYAQELASNKWMFLLYVPAIYE